MSRFRRSETSTAGPAPVAVVAIQPSAPSASAAVPVVPSAVRTTQLAVDARDTIRQLALLFALGFIFVRFTFIHEILAIKFNVRSFLPVLFASPAILGLVASGGLRRLAQYRASWLFLAFCGWLAIAAPFSSWPGDSLQRMTGFLQGQVPMFLLIGGLVVTWKDFKLVCYTIGLSAIVNEISARTMGVEELGRFGLEIVTIGNSNDFAAQLLLMMPLVALLGSRHFSKLNRVIVVPVFLFAMYLVLRTGSRGAFAAIIVTYLFLLVRVPGVQKVLMAVTLLVVLGGTLALMPGQVVQRLSTVLVSDSVEGEVQIEASQSTIGRRHLFLRSLELTGRYPIFGVGFGQFATVEGFDARSKGQRGQWMQAHNSYTQVSSESGIPAALLLIASLITAYRQTRRVLRTAREKGLKHLETAALAVMISFVSFGSAAMFLSLGFRFYFVTLIGLSLALSTVMRHEMDVAAIARPVSSLPSRS